MSTQGYDEAEAGRLLRAASDEYDDLPQAVAGRLDRVLEQLPSADTLHNGEKRAGGRWTERLRARGFRYALMSATAALLVTVGAVAAAVQIVSTSAGEGEGSVIAGEQPEATVGEHESESENGATAPEVEDFAADEEPQAEAPSGVDETGNVEMFATGSDYSEATDLLTALRDLDGGSPTGTVPEELAAIADGGTLWKNCQEAIAGWYDSLIVAADFARFDSQPAVLALLVTESGERAVAVTPDCAEGTIVELFAQE